MRLKSTLPDLTRRWNVKPWSGRRANAGCSVRSTACNAGYAVKVRRDTRSPKRRLSMEYVRRSPRQLQRRAQGLGLKAAQALVLQRPPQRNGATIFAYILRVPRRSCWNSMTMSFGRHGKPTNAGLQPLSRPCTSRHQQSAQHSAVPQSAVVRRYQRQHQPLYSRLFRQVLALGQRRLQQRELFGDRNLAQALLLCPLVGKHGMGLAAVAQEVAEVVAVAPRHQQLP